MILSRTLQWSNLLGILALAGLCAWQWQANRAAQLDASGLDQLRLVHEAKLTEQDKTLSGLRADLESLQSRLAKAAQERDTAQASLRQAASERDSLSAANAKQKALLAAQIDQFQKELDAWQAAVAARDAELKKAGDLIEKIAKERNADIERSNALVKQYNLLAKERDAAVIKFNDLAAKYNALAKQVEAENARILTGKAAEKQ